MQMSPSSTFARTNSRALADRTGARFLPVDLKDVGATQSAIGELANQGGAIDVLVNNAANDDRHSIDDVSEGYWDDRLNVNLKHQFFCAQAVAPGMRSNGGGAIVNLGSISWHLALPELVLYQTCKAAIEGMTSGARPRPRSRQYQGDLRRPRQCAGLRASCSGTRRKEKPRSCPRRR